MRHSVLTCLIAGGLGLSGCASGPSTRAAREQIAALGNAQLATEDVTVERIIAQTGSRAVAEATVKLAFEFENDSEGTPQIVALRLGDGRWLELEPLLAAVAAVQRDQTLDLMDKLVAGMNAYARENGRLPEVAEPGHLSDVLHPLFMDDFVREDAWGGRIVYESDGAEYRLRSPGPDGIADSVDDIVIQGSRP